MSESYSEKKPTSYEPLTTFECCSTLIAKQIRHLIRLCILRAKTMRTVQMSEGKTNGRYGRITQLDLTQIDKYLGLVAMQHISEYHNYLALPFGLQIYCPGKKK